MSGRRLCRFHRPLVEGKPEEASHDHAPSLPAAAITDLPEISFVHPLDANAIRHTAL
jgi:hypothetical protein